MLQKWILKETLERIAYVKVDKENLDYDRAHKELLDMLDILD